MILSFIRVPTGLCMSHQSEPPMDTKSSKRTGPLPLWLSEVVVIGFFAGMFAAATKFSKETETATGAVGKIVKSLAKKANLA